MLSISTCWNSSRHTDGQEMCQELLDLGFQRIELGHGIRLSLMEGVTKMFKAGKVRFSSLHNFCPLPIEITRASPDCYKFSSAEPRERERALKHTFQTIDFAERLEAPYVVLHLGRTPLDDYTDRLIRMAEVGLHNSRGFVKEKLECVRKREEKVGPYLKRAIDALEQIAAYAEPKGITLGIESRHSFEEIPTEREMLQVLEQFDVPHVGYWHDFGHVQVKHNLGFLDHVEWMAKIAPRLIGCHLHDTKWPGRDHMAPFTGDVEYGKLIPLLPRDTLYVLEMSPRRTSEEITTAAAEWTKRFGA
ncbi:MAG TPA: TIM barrel protein [Chthoniobacteraceae bacterium]|jgi:sugar phosphate isomerase/epimerase|nr:TIM barrel protein [Chthoniobacteraceae bacterium]